MGVGKTRPRNRIASAEFSFIEKAARFLGSFYFVNKSAISSRERIRFKTGTIRTDADRRALQEMQEHASTSHNHTILPTGLTSVGILLRPCPSDKAPRHRPKKRTEERKSHSGTTFLPMEDRRLISQAPFLFSRKTPARY